MKQLLNSSKQLSNYRTASKKEVPTATAVEYFIMCCSKGKSGALRQLVWNTPTPSLKNGSTFKNWYSWYCIYRTYLITSRQWGPRLSLACCNPSAHRPFPTSDWLRAHLHSPQREKASWTLSEYQGRVRWKNTNSYTIIKVKVLTMCGRIRSAPDSSSSFTTLSWSKAAARNKAVLKEPCSTQIPMYEQNKHYTSHEIIKNKDPG